MKNKLLLFFLFSILICIKIQAQTDNNYLVTGILTDSISGETIPYATVSASLVEAPLNYKKRVATNADGKFELELKNTGHYLIIFESVGMQVLCQQLTIEEDKKNYNLGMLKMLTADELLSELTVVAAKPLIKMDLDRIVYDTQSDSEATSNSVLEMLRKVPMVTVDGEDNIQVKGSSSFKVYINGKPSSVTAANPSQVLKSLPASTIKSIEVITEPGAKYDAEGLEGIINIVTEKTLRGYTGSVYAGIETTGVYYGGAYFSTKIGKFGITANTNYYHYQDKDRELETRREYVNPLPHKYMDQKSLMDVNYIYHFVNLEVSYEFDSLNLLSLSFAKNGTTQRLQDIGYTVTFFQNIDTSSFYSQEIQNKSSWNGLNMNLDYQRSFKKPDQLLTFSYRLGMSPIDSENKSIINVIKDKNNLLENSNRLLSSKGQSDEHTFQIDYVDPFKKRHVFETGIKYILRLNSSKNKSKTLENGEYEIDPDTLNRYQGDLNQTQHILGVYGSYTFKLDKFSVRAGARYEYTNSLVRYIGHGENNFNAPFSNFIPSLLLSYQPTMTSTLQLSYTQRISRPGIDYLNPFRDDSNPVMITYGNPKLKAEVNNTFNLSYGMYSQKMSLNASLFTAFNNNSIEQVTFVDERKNDGIIYQTYENIGTARQAGFTFYINWVPITALRLYTNGFISYIYYKSDFSQNDGIRYGAMGGAQINLPWQLKWNMNGGYYSPWISLQGEGSPYYFLGTSLSRDFFKNKLNITFRVSEPFRKEREFKYTSGVEGMYHSSFRQTSNALSFGLSVSYRFGEMKEQIKKAKRGISNDDMKNSSQGQGESSTGGGNVTR